MKLTGGLKLQRVGKITGGFQSSQRGRGGGGALRGVRSSQHVMLVGLWKLLEGCTRHSYLKTAQHTT